MITDRELAGRLRAAAVAEAEKAPAGDLAERLLTGARRGRRRAVLTRAAAAAVVVAASGAAIVVAVQQGDDRVRVDSAGPAGGRPVLPVSQAGAVTREMAVREGLDGTPQCRSDAVVDPEGAGARPGLELYGAFLTDARGLDAWQAEFAGSAWGAPPEGQPSPEPALIALCWFTGPIGPDGSGLPGRAPTTHQLVAVQISGPAASQGLRLSTSSPRSVPVLVPPVPALPAQDPLLSQGLRTAVQPPGVPVVDELPRQPEPEPAPPPVDCTPTACADPAEETLVGVQVLIDGEPLDPRGERQITSGRDIEISLTVDVEQGQTIQDVRLGVSSTGVGAGQGEPLGLDAELLREATAAGKQTYRVTWTVPDGLKDSQLVVYYEFDKYEPGMAHARTVGGVTATTDGNG